EDKDCDESYYINLIKDYCNCESNFIYPHTDNFLENLIKIIYYQDEPTLGPGLYSQWHVMQLAKNKVKVLLDGQGGDELLGGYFYYFSAYLFTLLDSGKKNKLSYALKIIKEYPQIKALTKEDYNEGLIEMLRSLFFPRFFNNLLRMPKINFKKNKKISIYNPEFENLFFKEPLARKKEIKFKDKLNDLLYWSLTKTSIPALLRYEDRNSMAFSIEARTPFLDYRLVEFCLGLPYELKIKASTTKVIMRESLRGILPSEIINRSDKKGYPTPFSRWLRKGLGKSVEEILFSKPYFLAEILNLKELKSRFEKHLAGKNDYSWEIWRYLNLELWYQMFILRKIKL
ncbi:MAG: asparagine synthase, partial [Armatimonadetes bacterium]|nr:asparagine synthase [Armatimonadota bacterium]